MDVQVAVDVAPDGRGRVEATFTLDRAAAREAGDLRGQLKVDDLLEAGWEIDGPEPAEGGGVVIIAEREFEGPRDASRAIEELSGDEGPFRDFRIERHASFLRTRTEFRGTVDLQAGIDAFGDDELRARLGEPLGVDAEALRRRAGTALADTFGFEVVVRLPGDVSSNAPAKAANGAVWRPKLGEDVDLNARAEQWNLASIGFSALALLSGTATVFVVRHLLRRRRRRGRPSQVRPGATPTS